MRWLFLTALAGVSGLASGQEDDEPFDPKASAEAVKAIYQQGGAVVEVLPPGGKPETYCVAIAANEWGFRVGSLRNVTHLELRGKSPFYEPVHLPSVTHLRLILDDDNDVAADRLRFLDDLPAVESLEIECETLLLHEIELLQKWPRLRRLKLLVRGGFTRQLLRLAGSMEHLEHLTLDGELPRGCLLDLRRLGRLKRLQLPNMVGYERGDPELVELAGLEAFSQLERLALGADVDRGRLDSENLRRIVSAPRLKHLDIRGLTLDAGHYLRLAESRSLEFLQYAEQDRDRDDLRQLRQRKPGLRAIGYGPLMLPFNQLQNPRLTAYSLQPAGGFVGAFPRDPKTPSFQRHAVLKQVECRSAATLGELRAKLADDANYLTGDGLPGCDVPNYGLRFQDDRHVVDVLTSPACPYVHITPLVPKHLADVTWMGWDGADVEHGLLSTEGFTELLARLMQGD